MPRGFDPGQKFYVRHLPTDDKRRTEGKIYQIQVVDRHGLATAFAYLGDKEEHLEINGCVVPAAVIRAAKRQEPGKGDFVDLGGSRALPRDF